MKLIDAHIHLDQYADEEIQGIINGYDALMGLITVSTHIQSCQRNLSLSRRYQHVHAAFGFHPEQPYLKEEDINHLTNWMESHKDEMIAIGEVGLPYYLKRERADLPYEPYVELLEAFIILAKNWQKPIILHSVYEDAEIACRLLEKHSIKRAHFHWFKGAPKTVERMISDGYFISITPDVTYEKDIQQLVEVYPLDQLMIETDGPWPFEGPFKGKMTHPAMMEESIRVIARIKNMTESEVMDKIESNTKRFYSL